MKRLLSLAAILLTLTMVLSLAACGNESTPEEPDNQDSNGQTEVADPTPASNVDLAALRTQLLTDCGLTDYVEVETEALATVYGIDTAQVANSASFNAMTGAAFPDEVVMVQAVDETAAAAIAGNLENRLSAIAEQAASYDPESQALAEKCKVVTDGVYVGMFFSSHYDEMVSAFQSAIGA